MGWRQNENFYLNEIVFEKIGAASGPMMITITYENISHTEFVKDGAAYLKRVFYYLSKNIKGTPKWILEIKDRNGGDFIVDDYNKIEVAAQLIN